MKPVGLTSLLILFTVTACRKESVCRGGSGGHFKLVVKLQHHSVNVPGKFSYPDSLMIKYDATDFPGNKPSDFDYVTASDTSSRFLEASSLKCGSYFIFAAAYDSLYHKRVLGGEAYRSYSSEGIDTLVLPVTEQ